MAKTARGSYQKTLYFRILEFMYDRPDLHHTVEGLYRDLKVADDGGEQVESQLENLAKDGLIHLDDFLGKHTIGNTGKPYPKVDVYRITIEGFQFLNGKRHLEASSRTNIAIAALALVSLIASLLAVWINWKTLPLLESANETQLRLLEVTRPDTVNVIEQRIVHDTVKIYVQPKTKGKK